MAELTSEDFSNEAQKVTADKLEELRRLSYNDVVELPRALLEDIVVARKEIQMTIFRQQGLPNLDNAILVTVQLARASLGGIVSYHYERGLVYLTSGEVRDATESELLATGS